MASLDCPKAAGNRIAELPQSEHLAQQGVAPMAVILFPDFCPARPVTAMFSTAILFGQPAVASVPQYRDEKHASTQIDYRAMVFPVNSSGMDPPLVRHSKFIVSIILLPGSFSWTRINLKRITRPNA